MRKRGESNIAIFTIVTVAVTGALLSACESSYVPPPQLAQQLAAAGKQLPEHIDYNWDVRPILSQNCLQCHGLEPTKRKAGLRLDDPEYAYAKLPESPGKRAIVPGNPNKSEMVRRITEQNADERMPPLDTHKVLSPVEIATLIKWVEQGAEYKQHWAYITPRKAKPGATPFDAQAVNAIDGYIFARLDREQLKPSPHADKETLINRVTLDLTGLPPTLEEVDAFLADSSADAYEKLVDRLLKSKPYAERMAQMWLDVARYADTGGYLNDSAARLLHPYRDWVIEAFEKNIPYDKFVTWQLAGDLLPNPNTEQLLATSFLRMGKRNNEGGTIDEEFRVEYVSERTDLVGKAFMGLTVGCAKCHDHKYDVISQAEYYSLTGFFNSIDERGIHTENAGQPMGPTLPWPTPKQTADLNTARERLQAQEAEYGATLAVVHKDVAGKAKALAASPNELVAAVQSSIDAGIEAYYPLDATYVDSFESLMIGPSKGGAAFGRRGAAREPGEGEVLQRLAADDLSRALGEAVKNGYRFENPIAIQKRQLPMGLKQEDLAWTPSGLPGGAPGGINHATFIDGVKGKAALLNDTVGFAAKGVGRYERTQEFSLDLWIKLREGEPYDLVTVLYNQDRAGGGGYELVLENNRLKFNLSHVAPYNMLSVQTVDALPQNKWTHITLSYDGSSRAAGTKLYIDGAPANTEVVRDRLSRSTLPRGGHSLYSSYYGLAFGKRFQVNEFKQGAIDEIRVFKKALNPLEVSYLHDPASLARSSASFDAKALRQHAADLLADLDERTKSAKVALRGAREAEMRVESIIPQLMIVRDAPKPRPTYILERGLYNKHGKEVSPGLPERVFAADDKLPKNRLGLTQWLFDKKNPLTARVFVNRLWYSHFGRGIVETPEDFGTQSANPTHPELLDWLAVEFIESGWDIRHMQKIMVMSATYRQSSNISPDLLAKDPTNKWLARGPRYRLPAEMIRDGALFASGLLVDQIGGDSVFPYQPPRVWEGSSPSANIYPDSVPEDQYHRRSMYTYVKRNAQAPSMMVFDMADRNVSTVARKISNTPLQALVLMNDPQYVEAYRKMAERVLKTAAKPEDQIVTLFRLGTRRKPMAQELDALTKYRSVEVERMTKSKAELDKLLSVGVAPVDASVDKVQLGALTMVAATVMNSPDAYMLR